MEQLEPIWALSNVVMHKIMLPAALMILFFCIWVQQKCHFQRHPYQQVGSLSHYSQGIIHPRWLFAISSINSITKHFRYLKWMY